MNEKSVFEFGNEYQCRNYFNSNEDSGIEVRLNDEYLGKIVGLTVPDVEDEEENIYFDNEVTNWIVDNEY